MIRRAPLLSLVLLSALLADTAMTHAQDPSDRAWTTSWTTTVYVGNPAPRPRTSRIATGSLTPMPDKLRADARSHKHDLEGIASYYWQNQQTASGERFDKSAMTAAHRTLPFGTKVRVTNIANGQSAIVRINDRGPFKPGRVIDVSDAAAGVLGFRARGLTLVRVEIVSD